MMQPQTTETDITPQVKRKSPPRSKQNGKPASEMLLAAEILDVVPGLMRRIRSEFRIAARGELTVPQLRILSQLNRGLRTAGELAEQQGVSMPAISRMIESLVRRDLVKRSYMAGNRKQIFLHLTPRGKKCYLASLHSAQRKIGTELTQLSPADRTDLGRSLEILRRVLA